MGFEEALEKVVELLSEVAEKKGAYSRDHLQHATNVIENASSRAKESIKILQDAVAGCKDHYISKEKLEEWQKNRPKYSDFSRIDNPLTVALEFEKHFKKLVGLMKRGDNRK